MTRKTRLHVVSLDDRCLPSFSPATSYAAGTDPKAVVTADFNNDSVLDIAVANTGSGTVSLLLGNANGTLQAAINAPTGNQPTSLAVGDFNEDGTLDVVTGESYPGSSSNDVTVLLGDGNGTFDPPTSLMSFGWGVDTVAVGDFNADGNLDLAITSVFIEGGGYDGSYVAVLPGTGAGTFTTPPDWPWEGEWSALGGTEFLPDSVVADFNADGKLDIAAPSFYGQLPVALGNGVGTFGGQTVFSGATEGSSIVAADFNADGKVDLAVAGNSSVRVLLGNGTGYFDTTQTYNAGSGSLSDLAVADFNGDGKLDLIASNTSNGTVNVLLGTGAGAFNLAVNAAVGTGPAGVAVGDFNGDSRPDVAVSNAGSKTVTVLLNDGTWPVTASLQVGDVTVAEGNSGTQTATFTVTLSTTSAQTITVAYATGNGTASAGSDFQAASGTLTFDPGETSKTITVVVNGDRLGEINETFVVNLSGAANATLADGQAVGTIADDEPRISIGDVAKLEGKKGQATLLTFTVTLSAAYDQAVSMSFHTVNGTAKSGEDYVARTGTLTFAPGEMTKTITIEVKGDNKAEANEMSYLDLFGNSSNSLFTKYRGIGTILNDD